MARQRFCKVCEGWHDLDKPWPHNCRSEPNWNRSELSGPMVISDCMDGVQSQLDGKWYDSKSSLRKTYRQAGVTEVGNDAKAEYRRPKVVDRKEIRESVEKACARMDWGA